MHVVYVLAAGRYVKIGRSSNLKSRIATLQTGSPNLVYPLAYIPVKSQTHAGAIEKSLHEHFAWAARQGEWHINACWIKLRPALRDAAKGKRNTRGFEPETWQAMRGAVVLNDGSVPKPRYMQQFSAGEIALP